jgi:hypothetical protein
MKKLLLVVTVITFLFGFSAVTNAAAAYYVSGYYKRFIQQGYYRSRPNAYSYDNYSYKIATL